MHSDCGVEVAEMMRPDAINSHLRQMRPVIMDHTVREPATTTPFGHTGYMKWLTLKIIQKMNIKDIAISVQYYGSSYTPETQILEWLHYKGESMDGMVVMFAPGEREAGIKAIRDYQIPNAFLDLTLKAGKSSACHSSLTFCHVGPITCPNKGWCCWETRATVHLAHRARCVRLALFS